MGVLFGTIQTYIPYGTTFSTVIGEKIEFTEYLYELWHELHPFGRVITFLLVLGETIPLKFGTSVPSEELEDNMT